MSILTSLVRFFDDVRFQIVSHYLVSTVLAQLVSGWCLMLVSTCQTLAIPECHCFAGKSVRRCRWGLRVVKTYPCSELQKTMSYQSETYIVWSFTGKWLKKRITGVQSREAFSIVSCRNRRIWRSIFVLTLATIYWKVRPLMQLVSYLVFRAILLFGVIT